MKKCKRLQAEETHVALYLAGKQVFPHESTGDCGISQELIVGMVYMLCVTVKLRNRSKKVNSMIESSR